MPETESDAGGGAVAPVPDLAPPTLRWAVRLLAGQAVALGGLVLLLAYEDVTAPAHTIGSALMVTGFTAFMAAVFAVLAAALRRRRAWARGPAIVLELLLLPMGYSMTTTGLVWLGLPVMAIGLAGAGLLLAFPTRAALVSKIPLIMNHGS